MLQLTIDGKEYNIAESLKEAVQMGVKRYIPSGTCTKGHRSVFMVKVDKQRGIIRGACIECNRGRQKEHNRSYYKKNTELCKLKAKLDYYQKQTDKALDRLIDVELQTNK